MISTIILKGFSVTLSLIFAIGAQNVFVLKQGLKKEHVLPIILICIFIDVILISTGVFGIGYFVAQNPFLLKVIGVIGIAFLCGYALICLRSAFKNEHMDLSNGASKKSLKEVITLVLVFSLLNPHTYLDTILLIGGIGASYVDLEDKLFFLLGCIVASIVWFISLGFGSRILIPLFQKNITWKILDILIAILLFSIAYSLTDLLN
ncbi:MAG: LysE family transporter [Campylobacteraceae bacterium]|nr:LysE family transporter [Campylobacteraceae bacterium]